VRSVATFGLMRSSFPSFAAGLGKQFRSGVRESPQNRMEGKYAPAGSL
jgi:hypothetical protein